jgi:hypothetical protein
MRTKQSKLTKKGVLRTLREMPDTFHTEELIERLILLSKLGAGMADAKAGRTLSIEEMREHIRFRHRAPGSC